jgi:hypothetical protein
MSDAGGHDCELRLGSPPSITVSVSSHNVCANGTTTTATTATKDFLCIGDGVLVTRRLAWLPATIHSINLDSGTYAIKVKRQRSDRSKDATATKSTQIPGPFLE